MPRPILGVSAPLAAPSVQPVARPTAKTATALDPAKLMQRLRERRSPAYIQAIQRLDAGTHLRDQSAITALLDAIAAEFPDVDADSQPLGYVARCHLGPPYVVHICDLSGRIVEHYEAHRTMPPFFERARGLAQHPAYVVIEIYRTALRAVAVDGSVSVIES